MHLHLDAVGGVAGDMFIASVLDAFPDLRDGLIAAIRSAGLPGALRAGAGVAGRAGGAAGAAFMTLAAAGVLESPFVGL